VSLSWSDSLHNISNDNGVLKKKWEYNETVHQLFIDFEKTCDSVRREVLYKILIELLVPMKLVKPIEICLNEICSNVCIPVRYVLYSNLSKTGGGFITIAFQLFFRMCHQEGPRKPG
jgi:hypothetical protein